MGSPQKASRKKNLKAVKNTNFRRAILRTFQNTAKTRQTYRRIYLSGGFLLIYFFSFLFLRDFPDFAFLADFLTLELSFSASGSVISFF